MSGEFAVCCSMCGMRQVVIEWPNCPRCGFHTNLCEKCVSKHNCKKAKKEAAAWENLRNLD